MNEKRILILHGWGASTKKLIPLKTEFENLGWEVLLPPLPGFDAPEPDNPWTLDDYASHVIKASNNKWSNDRYVVFGHSFGGRVAIKIATNNHSQIEAIVLCASGGISRGSFLKRSFFYVISKVGKTFLIFPPLANIFRRILYKAAREHDYEKSSELMKKTMKSVIGEDLRKLVKKVKLDTLILWGDNDKTTPVEDALFLDQNIKNSKLIRYSKQGHTLPYELPKKIAKEVDVWKQQL